MVLNICRSGINDVRFYVCGIRTVEAELLRVLLVSSSLFNLLASSEIEH